MIRIQDEPQNKTYLPKKKRSYPNQRQPPPPQVKRWLEKNILLFIAYTNYTKNVRFYLPLPNSVTVSVFKVSAFTFLTLTPNILILFTVIPQHIAVSSIPLDIQHFLKNHQSLLVKHAAMLL